MCVLTQTAPKSKAARHLASPGHGRVSRRWRQARTGHRWPSARPCLLVAEPLHGDHRPEDLVLDHLVVLTQVGDHGRLMEEAAGADSSAAGDDLGMVGRTREEALHARELVRVVDRPERRVRRRTGRRPWCAAASASAAVKSSAIRSLDQHPARGRAVLPGVEVAGAGDAGRRRFDVDVVEDHAPAPCRRVRGAYA